MKKASRIEPAELVSDSMLSSKRGTNWIEKLDVQDKIYVHGVVAVTARTPGVAMSIIATKLKDVLKLTVSVQTIARDLTELLKNA